MLLRPQHVGFGDLPNLMGHPQQVQEDQRYVDSRCSRHMTRNMSYISNFKEFNVGYVTFRGGANGGRITGKGTIHTATKDETSDILKKFITEIKNLVDKKVKDDNGVNKDSGIDAHEKSTNSINDVNTIGPSINTASIDFDTNSLNINTVSPIVSTASPEATHVDILGDKPERDMSNINTTYQEGWKCNQEYRVSVQMVIC
nr:putative ribonuclease H-like domain-containing protein [Tanacetum cinerariifolium]